MAAELRPGHDDVDEQQHDRHRDRQHLRACARLVSPLPARDRDDEEEQRREQRRAPIEISVETPVDLLCRADEQRERRGRAGGCRRRCPSASRARPRTGPSLIANSAMISSGALPKVALRKPPIPGPVCCGGVLGRLADQPRQRDERDRGEHEQRDVARRERRSRTIIVIGARPSDAQRSLRATRAKPTGAAPAPCLNGTRLSRLAQRRSTCPQSRVELASHCGPVAAARPQDEVECRRCGVHCDKIVYPAACIDRACPFVYAYEEFGHTYIGCMQKVYDVEIDVDLLREAERRRGGFGAVRSRRQPLPMCRVEVEETYHQPQRRPRLREPRVLRAAGRAADLPRLRAGSLRPSPRAARRLNRTSPPPIR